MLPTFDGGQRALLDAEIQENREFESIRNELSAPAEMNIFNGPPAPQAQGLASASALTQASLRKMAGWSASSAMPLQLYLNTTMDTVAGIHRVAATYAEVGGRAVRFSGDAEVLEATERMWSRVFERAPVRNAYANILALRVNADELTISAAFGAGVDALNSLSTGQTGSTDVRVGRILHGLLWKSPRQGICWGPGEYLFWQNSRCSRRQESPQPRQRACRDDRQSCSGPVLMRDDQRARVLPAWAIGTPP